MRRRPYIVGNWKMYKNPAEADALAAALKRGLADQAAADVGVAPPSLAIPAVVARLKQTGVRVEQAGAEGEMQRVLDH